MKINSDHKKENEAGKRENGVRENNKQGMKSSYTEYQVPASGRAGWYVSMVSRPMVLNSSGFWRPPEPGTMKETSMEKLQAGGVAKTNTQTEELLELLRIPPCSWNLPPSWLPFTSSVHGKCLPGSSPPKQSSPLLPTQSLHFPHPSLFSVSDSSH